MQKSKQSCRVCNNDVDFLWAVTLLSSKVSFAECSDCGYVQSEFPFWLEKAYTTPINKSDTGVMVRNLENFNSALATLLFLRKIKGRIVDCAGGYGVLVRLLRDFGIDASWSDKYCENLFSPGFEYCEGKADLVTVFEAFEHFVDPNDEIENLFKIAPNVLFSTQLIPRPTPEYDKWWYYGQEHGQHVGFFRYETLKKIADKYGKFLISDGTYYHLFSERPLNKVAWKIHLKLSRLYAPIIKRGIDSRTWPDHILMKEQN